MLRLTRVTPATVEVLRELSVAEGPIWGLRIVGLTGRPAGSVYPILARLEEGGWVRSRWDETEARGARRRLYEFTEDGRASAESLVARDAALESVRESGSVRQARPGLA